LFGGFCPYWLTAPNSVDSSVTVSNGSCPRWLASHAGNVPEVIIIIITIIIMALQHFVGPWPHF
jgi:hypothetical protein